MNDGIRVVGPALEAGLAALGDKRVGFDGVNAVVIACNDEFSRVRRVGKPDLVPDEEPVGVVLLV